MSQKQSQIIIRVPLDKHQRLLQIALDRSVKFGKKTYLADLFREMIDRLIIEDDRKRGQ